jgi:glycosyltransferase involved in cell wall biosynthesis
MACAKPVVIAGDTVGPFGGNFGGIVTPNNVNALRSHNFTGRNSTERTTAPKIAEACIRLLGDQESSRCLGDFGRKYVEREHDIEKKAKDIVRLYQESLN